MPLKALVIGKTLLVRQPIAQALETLDFQVIETSEISEAIAAVQSKVPTLVVMDTDGMARDWRVLAAGMSAQQSGAIVLIASRFDFNDVHDAQALRVAGVIVKPFRREEHTERLLDIALRRRNIKARRSAPRFTMPKDAKAELRHGHAGKTELFPLLNIAEGGAKVIAETGWQPDPDAAPSSLSWGNAQLEISIELIHRQKDGAGIRFTKIWDGAPRLLHALEERQACAPGSVLRAGA